MDDELVSWDESLMVHNKVIDTQHRELVEMTNKFYAGVKMGGLLAKAYLLQTIKGSVNYIKTHFADEEEIMQKIGFPLYEEHKKQHENFISEVKEQARAFENDVFPDPAGFVIFLMNWILQHIANSDKKYVPYLEKLK